MSDFPTLIAAAYRETYENNVFSYFNRWRCDEPRLWRFSTGEADFSSDIAETGEHRREINISLTESFSADFVLWMPVGDQSVDSLRGLLLERNGDRMNGQIVGGTELLATDECRSHQFLNNAVMNTKTPDGRQETFNLYEIEDVRRLERMGYNFATMEWDSPGQFLSLTKTSSQLDRWSMRPNRSARSSQKYRM